MFLKKISKFLYLFKSYEHFNFRTRLVISRFKMVKFTSILMFQRANISLFGEAGSLLLGFSYSLGGIIDENEKNHFWLFSAFGRLLKKKDAKKCNFSVF